MIVLPNARRLVSPPSEEPISLTKAKLQCVVKHTLDDILFTSWIAGARFHGERLSGEKFITQQWEFTFPSFPSRREKIKIPYKPVQTVDSIVYIDETGTEQTFGTLSGSPLTIEEYSLVRDTEAPYVCLNLNHDWPTPAKVDNAVRMTVTVGYNDTAVDFQANPQTHLYTSGMLLLIAHFNENREAVIVSDQNPNAVEIPLGIQALLRSPKVG